jgi:O-antigen ligase
MANPHNQYLFVLTTTGVLGGAALALVLLPPTLWRRQDPELDGLRLALLVFIGAICMLESYLWRSNTSLLYVLFAVALHGKVSRQTGDRR